MKIRSQLRAAWTIDANPLAVAVSLFPCGTPRPRAEPETDHRSVSGMASRKQTTSETRSDRMSGLRISQDRLSRKFVSKKLSHPWCFGTFESSGHWRSTSVAVAQVSVGARQLESFTSCRRQAPTGRRANPTLVGGSDDEAARTGRCRARAPPSGRLGNWSSACQTTRCTQPIDPSGGSYRPGHWVH
jgi:hypothetical protein